MRHQYVRRGIDIDAIRARSASICIVAYDQPIHRDALRVADVHRPEARPLERQATQIDVGGLIDLDEAGPLAIVVHCPTQALGLVFLAPHLPILVPPDFAVAIDGTLAADLHVRLLVHVDQRRRPWHLDARHARLHQGVRRKTLHTADLRAFLQAELHARFEKQGARQVHAGLEDYNSVAGLCRCVDGLLYGVRVHRLAIAFGAVRRHIAYRCAQLRGSRAQRHDQQRNRRPHAHYQ